MKQIHITARLILLMMLMLPAKLVAQEALFEKFNDTNGISTVYISKTMLQMVPNVKAGKHPVGNIASKLDQLRVLNCERPSMIANIKKQFTDYYKKNKYEVVMQANEEGEHVTIYHRPLKAGKSEFALMAQEEDGLNIIFVSGNITLKDIQQITGN